MAKTGKSGRRQATDGGAVRSPRRRASPEAPPPSLAGELHPDILRIIDALPFYVILVDEHHRIISANEAVTRDLKVDRSKIEGQYCPKAVHGIDGIFAGCPLEESVHKRGAVEKEYFDDKTGKWMESGIYPTSCRTRDGRQVFFHTARDISERKVMQAAMVGMERLAALGQFSGGVSHELRDPLSVIGISMQVLKTRLEDPSRDVREEIGRIDSELEKIWIIIEALLSLAAMKEPKIEELDLVGVVCSAINAAAVPDTVDIVEQFPEQEILVSGDWAQLRMAFQNIVDNAIQVMDGKGCITVGMERTADGLVEVSISDTGPGIRPEDKEMILQPFFSQRPGGLGLGLSIANAIVEKHGGTITARSESGKGATMVVRVPLTQPGTPAK